MSDYIQFALEELKKSGLKITEPRKMLVSLLDRSDKVLSPYEMRDALQKEKIRVDVVTIYRILELLENLGLVHKVLAFNGYIRCSMENFSNKKCHHYLLCKECRKVEEVEGEDLTELEEKITQKYRFSIDSHYLEFMGVCGKCRSD